MVLQFGGNRFCGMRWVCKDNRRSAVAGGDCAYGVWCVWSGFQRCDGCCDGCEFLVGVGEFASLGFDYGCGCVVDEAFVGEFFLYGSFESGVVVVFFAQTSEFGFDVEAGGHGHFELKGAYEEGHCGGVFFGIFDDLADVGEFADDVVD